MSKPYTQNDLSRMITSDRTWRIKEISDLKTAIGRSDDILQKVLLRSLVTICYAHWEGHVRVSAKLYLTHVAIRKLPFSRLDNQFLFNYFLPRISAISNNSKSIDSKCDLLLEILNSSGKQYSKVNDDLINTKSNLNSDTLRDICKICQVSFTYFENDISFIDSILLKRRNSIAHGEDTFIAVKDMNTIAEKTIALMRTFGDAIDNIVQTESYRVA